MSSDDSHTQCAPERPLSHDELRELLPAYVADVTLRATPPEREAEIAAHLRECAACRAEAEELGELLAEAAAGVLPAASSYSPPRLDFLRAAARSPWSLDELGRLVVCFSADLLDQLRPAAPGLARTVGRRGSQLYQYDHARFAPAEPAPQPARHPAALTISVFGVGPGPDVVEVVVRVGVAGRRATDLAGSEVTLAVGETLLRGLTDKFGYATFPDIAASDMPRIQVTINPTAGRSA